MYTTPLPRWRGSRSGWTHPPNNTSSMLSLWLPQQSRGWGLLRVARCTDTSQTPLHPAPGHLDAPHALVLYHWPCTDGVFGAFGAYLYHKRTQRPVAFVPNAVTAPPRVQDLPITKDTHTVYLVDYVGPPGFVQDLATAHPHVHVVVLDHHKTAVALLVEPYQHLDKHQQLPTNVEVHLDMERSGATLSWDYFAHKLEQERNLEAGKGGLALAGGSAVLLGRLQRMFRYVEDSDLWRWSDLDSGSFVSGLSDLHLNYHANANRGIFEQLCALDPDHLISVGAESRVVWLHGTVSPVAPLCEGWGRSPPVWL